MLPKAFGKAPDDQSPRTRRAVLTLSSAHDLFPTRLETTCRLQPFGESTSPPKECPSTICRGWRCAASTTYAPTDPQPMPAAPAAFLKWLASEPCPHAKWKQPAPGRRKLGMHRGVNYDQAKEAATATNLTGGPLTNMHTSVEQVAGPVLSAPDFRADTRPVVLRQLGRLLAETQDHGNHRCSGCVDLTYISSRPQVSRRPSSPAPPTHARAASPAFRNDSRSWSMPICCARGLDQDRRLMPPVGSRIRVPPSRTRGDLLPLLRDPEIRSRVNAPEKSICHSSACCFLPCSRP